MFQDVGKEIKNIAEGYVWGKTLRYGFLGFAVPLAVLLVVGADGIAGFVSVIAAVIFAVIGYSTGRRDALMFYAWGEVVDRVISLERKLSGECERQTAVVKKVKVAPDGTIHRPPENDASVKECAAPTATRFSSGVWRCAYCEHFNKAEAASCAECGVVPEFE